MIIIDASNSVPAIGNKLSTLGFKKDVLRSLWVSKISGNELHPQLFY